MANVSGDAWVLLAPLPALALGVLVATWHGVPWTAFLPNALAVALGTLGAGLFMRAMPRTRESLAKGLPVAAFLGIAMTLLASGLDAPIPPIRMTCQ